MKNTTIETIKQAILKLEPQDVHALMDWLIRVGNDAAPAEKPRLVCLLARIAVSRLTAEEMIDFMDWIASLGNSKGAAPGVWLLGDRFCLIRYVREGK